MADKTRTTTQKQIAHQWLITQYTDGTTKITEVKTERWDKVKRDAHGRFRNPVTESPKGVTPDTMVTCPYCGRAFRVGQKNVSE